MAITFIQTDEGFNVQVPYEIKDDFKRVFRTAKWNSFKKVWQVGKTARKKLEQFNETFNEKVEEIEQQAELDDQILLTEKEIETINVSLSETIERLGSVSGKIEKLENIKRLLDAKKLELDELKIKVDEQNAISETELSELQNKVFGIISVDRILGAWNEMRINSRQLTSYNKDKFHTAQNIIIEENKLLEEIGLTSSILDIAGSLNWNRSHGNDRDSPFSETLNKETIITTIKEI